MASRIDCGLCEWVSWAVAAAILLVPITFLQWLKLPHADEVLVVVFAIALLGSVFGALQRLERPKADGNDLSALKTHVNEYCRQPCARRKQRAWLVLSLLCFVSGYWIWAQSHIEIPEIDVLRQFIATLGCWLISFLAMVTAGVFAEENPATDGRDLMVQVFKAYAAKNPSARTQAMLTRIDSNDWRMEDLRDYAISEGRKKPVSPGSSLYQRIRRQLFPE